MSEKNNTPNKVTLVDERGERTLHIGAEILPDGDLRISGHDLSPGLQNIFGPDADEYEYWFTIPKEQKDHVLLALLSAFYDGKPDGESKFKQLLETHGIPCKFSNYF
jgi:hypothetical protein